MKAQTRSKPIESLDEIQAVGAFAALAQPQRLRAFRALVVAGPEGLTPGGTIAITPTTWTATLRSLSRATSLMPT